MKCIAYTNNVGNVCVLHPSPEFKDKINIIADKDVPIGIYYKIMNVDELPSREFRQAWELTLDENNSDGVGLSKDEFYKKYPDLIGWAVH